MQTTCLSEQELKELAAALCEGAEPNLARAHLDQCSTCRDALEEWKKNLLYLKGLKGTLTLDLDLGGFSGDAMSVLEERFDWSTPGEQLQIPGYEIIREIHRGGQGIVYEAVQRSTRRTVAVKVLLEGSLASERDKWRFEREVKLVAALRHPHIVVIHDSGIAHGQHFFAMDYVRGEPLNTHVRLKAPTVRETAPLFRQVCEAVAYAHGRGVIHRDLKPSNILVSAEGVPCILDFGLAKLVGDKIVLSQGGMVSLPGNLMGTLRYMAPEQTIGDPGKVDVRTDVYALGVILYELLTGQAPYATDGDLAVALRNIRELDPPRPSSLRREARSELDAIVLKALEKEPDRRYQTASQFADDLAAWIEGRPISAKSASSLYVLRKLAVRHGFESIVIATLLLAMASFAYIGLQGVIYGERQRAAREASDSALANVDEAKSLADLGIRKALPQFSLGWFMDEWHAGRHQRASAIRDQVAAGEPEHTAMTFLLEGGPVDQFRARMSSHAGPLTEFVIGARHAVEGDTHAALKAFKASRRAAVRSANRWWQATADARIAQLERSVGSASAPASGRAAR